MNKMIQIMEAQGEDSSEYNHQMESIGWISIQDNGFIGEIQEEDKEHETTDKLDSGKLDSGKKDSGKLSRNATKDKLKQDSKRTDHDTNNCDTERKDEVNELAHARKKADIQPVR